MRAPANFNSLPEFQAAGSCEFASNSPRCEYIIMSWRRFLCYAMLKAQRRPNSEPVGTFGNPSRKAAGPDNLVLEDIGARNESFQSQMSGEEDEEGLSLRAAAANQPVVVRGKVVSKAWSWNERGNEVVQLDEFDSFMYAAFSVIHKHPRFELVNKASYYPPDSVFDEKNINPQSAVVPWTSRNMTKFLSRCFTKGQIRSYRSITLRCLILFRRALDFTDQINNATWRLCLFCCWILAIDSKQTKSVDQYCDLFIQVTNTRSAKLSEEALTESQSVLAFILKNLVVVSESDLKEFLQEVQSAYEAEFGGDLIYHLPRGENDD